MVPDDWNTANGYLLLIVWEEYVGGTIAKPTYDMKIGKVVHIVEGIDVLVK